MWRKILDRRREELARACVAGLEDTDWGAAAPLLDALAADPPAARVNGVQPLALLGEVSLLASIHRLREALLEQLSADAVEDRREIRERADTLALSLLEERARIRSDRDRCTQSEAENLAHHRRLQALGQLTSAVAHTYNNLLTVVAGYASALETSPGLDDRERRAVDRIAVAAAQATSMTEQLVRASRGDPPRITPVHPLAFLNEARDLLRSMVGRSIQLEVLAQQDLPRVLCDPARLHEAVLYLTANAREAMPAGGTLTLSAYLGPTSPESDDGEAFRPAAVVLEVRDSGEGIAAEDLSRVFEPGFSTRARPGATGLGCAQVRAIVGEWGGSVDALSTPGEGARFLLRLPVA